MFFLAGCALNSKTYPGPEGITYRRDKNLHKVWMAQGFNFTGYDTIYVAETGAMIAPLREESQAFDFARRLVQEEFAAAIQETRLFQHVVTRESDIQPGAKVLKFETKITQFRKGNDLPPIITVFGRMLDNARPVFQFESQRKGDVAGSRPLGFEVRTMAKALGEFIQRKAGQSPRT
jgi:hypothetical protein